VCREIEGSVLFDAFGAVVCNEDIVNKKPHPEGLERAMRTLDVSSAQCAYVGDAPEDIEMGRRGNVLTIGVHSAYPSSSRVLSAKPDIYLERLTELLDHF
jgi:phosphoglycolate phosphatase-like HAD superfamily hydrolase